MTPQQRTPLLKGQVCCMIPMNGVRYREAPLYIIYNSIDIVYHDDDDE